MDQPVSPDSLEIALRPARRLPAFRNGIYLAPTVGAYAVYDELIYTSMTFDHRRNDVFRAAIAQVVPGLSVVDIGTGKDLVLTRMCLEAGARHIYAIERDRRAFELAAALLQTLPSSDRVTLIHGDSATVQLPEPVDLCVSELLGVVGGCEGAAVILNAARQKFLKPGARMIPSRCLTETAAVELPADVAQSPGCSETSWSYARRIFQRYGRPFDLRICIHNVPRQSLLSAPAIFEDLDASASFPTHSTRDITLAFHRPGRFDGLLTWLRLFTSPAHELVTFDDNQSNWLPLFLPLRGGPCPVNPDDTAHFTVETTLSDDGLNPDYRLTGHLLRPGHPPLPLAIDSLHHGHDFRAAPFHRLLFPEAGINVIEDRPPRNPWTRLRRKLSEWK